MLIAGVLLRLFVNGNLYVCVCSHQLSDLMGMMIGLIYKGWLFYAL